MLEVETIFNSGTLNGGWSKRRRYMVKVNDARTDELREVILTPYADAGNEGAAFRTAFPKNAEEQYPSDWKEE